MHVFTAAGTVLVLLIIGAGFLIIARKILRVALKLAFVIAVLLVLIVGAGIGWWQGWFSSSQSDRRPATTSNQRANVNRHRP